MNTSEVGWQTFVGHHVFTTINRLIVRLRGGDELMMSIARNRKIYLMSREYMKYYYSISSVPPLEQDSASWFTLTDEQIRTRCKIIV
jgi:hypothetical protein